MHLRPLQRPIIHFAAILLCGVASTCSPTAHADRPTSTVPKLGVRDRSPNVQAFVGATIVTQAGVTIANGKLVIDRGIITAVGADVSVPVHAHVIDMSGRIIYPGLIEPYSEITSNQEQSQAAHWNKYVHPEREAANDWTGSASNAQLREAGFALQLIVPNDGILKGQSSIATTGTATAAESIVARQVAHHVRLTSPSGANRKTYPNSPMGAVALARQTFYDADWYANAWRAFRLGDDVQRPETNIALEALAAALSKDDLFVFDAPDEQYVLRANQFAVEFGLRRVAIRGSGREYQRLDAVTATGRPMIIPINFAKPPNVSTAEAARDATLSALMHWHFAPENPARLHGHGVTFALTSHRT